jgi:membrane associated rhomboid family serine protease
VVVVGLRNMHQIWRLLSCFFIHSLGIAFLMNMVFLYKHSSMLEQSTYDGRTSDYIFMLLCGGGVLLVCAAVVVGGGCDMRYPQELQCLTES